ncbi:sensor histidine kinase [Paenibacillus sp. J5C_2022]|nr:sensor histidine kinase [Paenibacillus sp. J5C2022]
MIDIRSIKGWSSRLNFRKKLLILFIALILLPLSLQGAVTYRYFSSTMDDKTERYTIDLVRQINLNLDRALREMQRLSLMPVYDEKVLSILKKYDGTMGDADRASSEDYQKMKLYTSAQAYNREEIRGIHIVSNSGIFFSNVDAMDVPNVWDGRGDAWFDEVERSSGAWVLVPQHKPSYYLKPVAEPVISVARAIREPSTLERIGYIIIDMKLTAFRTILANLNFEPNAHLIIMDGNQRLLFETERQAGVSAYEALLQNGSSFHLNQTDRVTLHEVDYMLVQQHSSYSGVSVLGLIPTNMIQKESRQLGLFTMWFASLCVLVAVLLAIIVAYRLTRPLIRLKNRMILAEQGQFNQRITIEQQDELGQLGRGFNRMMEEIERLFKEVLLLGVREKEAELAALQSQIRPHFIYNTLESISMMAVRSGAMEASDMVSALGRLLRYTIDKADRLVPLREEMQFVRSYVQIQQMRYGERLRVEYDIEDGAEHILIPKLTIQPLVENAVFHGIDPKERGGQVWISALCLEEVLLITVRDDGAGLEDAEIAEWNARLRERTSTNSWKKGAGHGIGISNIYERISFIYGNQGDVTVDGSKGYGLTVTVTIPLT